MPERRVVLLGASNLTRGISTVVETARRIWGRPLDVWAAFGHGRSYGMTSRVLGRDLPGIVQCGLWPALARSSAQPTAALITDIGNDIVYGASVADIFGWVRFCVEQLQQVHARIVMTQLPLQTARTTSERRYRLFRSILFPSSRLPLVTVIDRAVELNELLGGLCARHAITFAEPRAEWFGFDPIHIRMRHWPRAWIEILSPWSTGGPMPAPARGSIRRWLRLRMMAPERRWFFGFEQRRRQPAGRLPDGTIVSLF